MDKPKHELSTIATELNKLALSLAEEGNPLRAEKVNTLTERLERVIESLPQD